MREKMMGVRWVLALVLFGGVFSVEAGSVKVKAKGSVPYGMRAGKNTRREAIEDAKKNAVRNYASNWDSARYKMFDQAFVRVEGNIDQYVLSYILLDSGKNKTTKNYEAFIEATLNENAIEKLVGVTANSNASESGGKAPRIAMLMVARKKEFQKTFKLKKTDIAQSSHSGNFDESVDHFEDEETVRTTTGGSAERKASQVKYSYCQADGVDKALKEVFGDAGYKVADSRRVLGSEIINDLKSEFIAGSDFTKFELVDAKCIGRLSFFALGTMDVGMPLVDDVSGLPEVTVMVSIEVTDYRDEEWPETVASIAGVPYSALGKDDDTALRNALNMAAEKSAKDLVDQLRSKGVLAN